MNVLIISQCNKNALAESRRILDQFAERKGDCTWQTSITLQGLTTLRKLLRQTAKRNTAIACHWIKGRNKTELLWIVGNISKFNIDGSVPTNTTERDILRTKDENLWHTIEDIAIISGIAGLFHDFGKANQLFQKKINPKIKTPSFEPYRHEWVSLRLFEAFVSNRSDEEWLLNLKNINLEDEPKILDNLIKDAPPHTNTINPFIKMPKLAQAIAWIIVSHHRLLKYQEGDNGEPQLDKINDWMTSKRLDPSWNSIQSRKSDWNEKELNLVWSFPHGTPIRSVFWRIKAASLAKKAISRYKSLSKDWFQDKFSLHLSRLTMMLSDHYYSSLDAKVIWQDKAYRAYANTDSITKKFKQKLDEHNIGVGHNAFLLSKLLPKIRFSLPAITRHKGFKKRSIKAEFRWQDKAYDLARSIREDSNKYGFFGVNMASTGCGKTFANGRIMYGLSDEKIGCRISIALGLRTLTLQTGDALKSRLKLENDDLAVLVGSQSVKLLHDREKNKLNFKDVLSNISEYEKIGSESLEDFFSEHEYVKYEGTLDDGRLSHWLTGSPKVHKLLSAPILVSTIDHLIPATEGERGGRQIAPMLRLLTSDLILDEPDDFDLNDLPALSRLVNWAGMLGARVLLSSATLPPALIEALFDAYRSGREIFQKAVGEPNLNLKICCAWFDENNVSKSDHSSKDGFMISHNEFVDKRIKFLKSKEAVRKTKFVELDSKSNSPVDIIDVMAKNIFHEILDLHLNHFQKKEKKDLSISVGLIRIANITQLVSIANKLISYDAPKNHHLHYCIYHSQYPLAVRSKIESNLDVVLNRHNSKQIWDLDLIKSKFKPLANGNHIFIVIASPVSEVGRDHDYDWAIVEPSSMRSIIQLAGRVQRHRKALPIKPNIVLLNKNYKALLGKNIAYEKPGFETSGCALVDKNLKYSLLAEQIEYISSSPRIKERSILEPTKNFVDLEHFQLRKKLFVYEYHASLWWEKSADWCFELQRNTKFRESIPNELFFLYSENEFDAPQFCLLDDRKEPKAVSKSRFRKLTENTIQKGIGVFFWFEFNYNEIINQIAQDFNISFSSACIRFGSISLPEGDNEWMYHPFLGIYKEL
jgi:CRISPR-associated endonuclease/helicase Cas3